MTAGTDRETTESKVIIEIRNTSGEWHRATTCKSLELAPADLQSVVAALRSSPLGDRYRVARIREITVTARTIGEDVTV